MGVVQLRRAGRGRTRAFRLRPRQAGWLAAGRRGEVMVVVEAVVAGKTFAAKIPPFVF